MDPNPQEHPEPDPLTSNLPSVPTWLIVSIGLLVLVLLGALFIPGWVSYRHQEAALDERAAETSARLPVVMIAHPARMDGEMPLILPCRDARPWQATAMFPRTNGYLKELVNNIDIGDHVTEGQLLAVIDTPEIDAQLGQARAAFKQAQANVTKATADDALAQKTALRYQAMQKTGGVTDEECDEKVSAAQQTNAALEAARANVAAATADVDRLAALQNFEKVTAPFTGTITARNYDVGALLSPSDMTPGHELFRIENTQTLRVFVDVPQEYVDDIPAGTPAVFIVRNHAGEEFPGAVARTAGTLDAASRTLPVEVDCPNPKARLWAEMYGQVKFTLHRAQPPLLIPTSAMQFTSEGTEVVVVEGTGNRGRITYKRIEVGRDFGANLEVRSGLSGNEQIVANPGQRLAPDMEVEISTPIVPRAAKIR